MCTYALFIKLKTEILFKHINLNSMILKAPSIISISATRTFPLKSLHPIEFHSTHNENHEYKSSTL